MNPTQTLACILFDLPDTFHSKGLLMAISYAYTFDFANPLWSKATAVQCAVRSAMELSEARGKGSAAARRLSSIRAARMHVSLKDWLALEADMLEMDREEARAETQRWFEALQRSEEQEAPL